MLLISLGGMGSVVAADYSQPERATALWDAAEGRIVNMASRAG